MPPQRPPKPLHHIGITHALAGLKYAFTTQPNFKIHFSISLLVLFLATILKISTFELIILILCIISGITIELINTAVESVVDLVTEEWRQSAKLAKDVSSGAMLVTALGTAIVGLIILLPKFIMLFQTF